MSCVDRLNRTSVIDDRCVEVSYSYPYLNAGASDSILRHLINLDIDLQLPSHRNFEYYSPHDFHSNFDIRECFKNNLCFSTIHCNIRCLSVNFDNLLNMLSELYYSFSLIGLTETIFKVGQPEVTNINILGYQFFTSSPGKTFTFLTSSTTSLAISSASLVSSLPISTSYTSLSSEVLSNSSTSNLLKELLFYCSTKIYPYV